MVYDFTSTKFNQSFLLEGTSDLEALGGAWSGRGTYLATTDPPYNCQPKLQNRLMSPRFARLKLAG